MRSGGRVRMEQTEAYLFSSSLPSSSSQRNTPHRSRRCSPQAQHQVLSLRQMTTTRRSRSKSWCSTDRSSRLLLRGRLLASPIYLPYLFTSRSDAPSAPYCSGSLPLFCSFAPPPCHVPHDRPQACTLPSSPSLVSCIIRPYRTFLSLPVVLSMQCLLFAIPLLPPRVQQRLHGTARCAISGESPPPLFLKATAD